jgi:hypothetical protein
MENIQVYSILEDLTISASFYLHDKSFLLLLFYLRQLFSIHWQENETLPTEDKPIDRKPIDSKTNWQ